MKALDRIAIPAILAVAVFLTLVIRGEFFRHTPAPNHSPSPLVGATLRLPGVHFPAQRDSLVLGISTTCHFCKDSLPFYRDLATQTAGRLDVIAVLPQSKTDADTFLKDAGLTDIHVVSADLSTIGVYATPTLLLLDSTGKVKSVWLGKQDEAGQRKILAALLANAAAAAPRS